MKTRLLAIVVFLLSPATAARLLSPSPPPSVCDHKKTSFGGWLLLLMLNKDPQQDFPDGSFPSRGPTFPHASLISVDHSNSKDAS
jgi:hypothetical protein